MERDLDKKQMSDQRLPEVQLTLNEWLLSPPPPDLWWFKYYMMIKNKIPLPI